jgi:septal ring factor EnvC (AmiA/AmiB activator)
MLSLSLSLSLKKQLNDHQEEITTIKHLVQVKDFELHKLNKEEATLDFSISQANQESEHERKYFSNFDSKLRQAKQKEITMREDVTLIK